MVQVIFIAEWSEPETGAQAKGFAGFDEVHRPEQNADG
jgi:hypothetical protein